MSDELVEVDVDNLNNHDNIHNMTEQHYIELANQFKELMDEKIDENKKMERKMKDYQYMCFKVFGVITLANDLMNNMEFEDLGNVGITIQHNLEYIEEQLKIILKI